MRALPFAVSLLLLLSGPSMDAAANDPPRIESVSGPQSGPIGNPLFISVNATDPEGGELTFEWFMDGMRIGSGPQLRYYLFPGSRNVTLKISDPEGNNLTRSWIFSADPPPGWDDRPDNDKNRMIFWGIFGTSGGILIVVLTYIMFRKR